MSPPNHREQIILSLREVPEFDSELIAQHLGTRRTVAIAAILQGLERERILWRVSRQGFWYRATPSGLALCDRLLLGEGVARSKPKAQFK